MTKKKTANRPSEANRPTVRMKDGRVVLNEAFKGHKPVKGAGSKAASSQQDITKMYRVRNNATPEQVDMVEGGVRDVVAKLRDQGGEFVDSDGTYIVEVTPANFNSCAGTVDSFADYVDAHEDADDAGLMMSYIAGSETNLIDYLPGVKRLRPDDEYDGRESVSEYEWRTGKSAVKENINK